MDLMLDPVNQRSKVVFGTVLGIIAAIAVVTIIITYFLLRPLALLSQQAEVLCVCAYVEDCNAQQYTVCVVQSRLPMS